MLINEIIFAIRIFLHNVSQAQIQLHNKHVLTLISNLEISMDGHTSTGYHPLYNPVGCCQNAGGAQFVTAGAGLMLVEDFLLYHQEEIFL
jgi:hypothetical protein